MIGMRVFFTIFLISAFFTHNLYADYCVTNKGQTGFNCDAGKYYDQTFNIYIDCTAGYYCIGNGLAKCCNLATNGDFPESDELSTSQNDCYTNIDCHKQDNSTETCRYYYDGHLECPTISDPHIKPRTENCYADTRDCNKFGYNNCTIENITGTATWVSGNSGGSMSGQSYWDATNCRCGNITFPDNTNRFCFVTQTGVLPSNTRIFDENSIINYDTIDGEYYCTRCIPDNGDAKYYANTTYSNESCQPDITSGRVCKCETSNIKGYYRTGQCNNTADWTSSTICRRVACDIPGTTTAAILPSSPNNSVCIYTADTILADPTDDFTLGDIQSTYGLDSTGWELVRP